LESGALSYEKFETLEAEVCSTLAPAGAPVPWAHVEPWYLENEQALRDIGKFEGLKGVALEVWRAARAEVR
jgi:hypothetical protein